MFAGFAYYHAEVISSISDTSKCKSNIRNFLLHWWPLRHFQTWMVMKHGYFCRFALDILVDLLCDISHFSICALNLSELPQSASLASWLTTYHEKKKIREACFKHLCISFIIKTFYRKYLSSFRENRSGTLGSFLDSTGIFHQIILVCPSI